MIRDLKVFIISPLNIVHEFKMQMLQMGRVILRHAICNMEPGLNISQFFFLQTLFLV